MNLAQIVLNKAQCLQCGEELISHHRHDYKECGCPNKTSIDGGLDYLRYSAVDMEKIKPMVVYLHDGFDVVRTAFQWKSGNDYITLDKMTNPHIQKILALLVGRLPNWVERLFVQELAHRKQLKLYIKDANY